MKIGWGNVARLVASLLFCWLTLFPMAQVVDASCWKISDPAKMDGGCSDSCNSGGAGAAGIACYSCGTDPVFGYYCWYHAYACDSPCGGNGGDDSGGGFEAQGCPNGTTLVCNNSAPLTCVRHGVCDDSFPSSWDHAQKPWCKKSQPEKGWCNTDCTCEAACTPTAPSVTTLSSPANGASLSSTSVNLLWNTTSSWGTTCNGGANEYEIYVGACPNPSTLVETLSGTENSYTFDGALDTTYCWKIRTTNGQVYTDSSVGSFTVLGNQVSGGVFYDVNNNCGGAGSTRSCYNFLYGNHT